jgi:prepilin-type N-terminal cleavage/methylation domain-containing protein
MDGKQTNKRTARNRRGFTLIEVLMVMAILAIGILAVASMQMISVSSNAASRRISEKTALAENQIERLLKLPYDHNDLDPAQNPHQTTQGVYAVNWNVTDTDLDGDGTNDAKTITVDVSRTNDNDANVTIRHIILEL